MEKLITLKKNSEFKAVYNGSKDGSNKTKSAAGKHLVVLMAENNCPSHRFGITISRKIGKAAARNKLRRRIREILRAFFRADKPSGDPVNIPKQDFVIIARNGTGAAEITFAELKNGLDRLLTKLPANPSHKPLIKTETGT